MTVFDSDLIIDYLRGAEPGVTLIDEALARDALVVTAMTVAELTCGARTKRAKRLVAHVLDAAMVLPVGAEEGRLGGEIYRRLLHRGAQMGLSDCLIAATCLRARATLATRNRKHFERVEELSLEPL